MNKVKWKYTIDDEEIEFDVNLISPEIDSNTYIDVEQILHNATITGNEDIVYSCIESKLPINNKRKCYLQNATTNNHLEIVRLLLEYKLYDSQDFLIALELAYKENHTEIYNLLNKDSRQYKVKKLIDKKKD